MIEQAFERWEYEKRVKAYVEMKKQVKLKEEKQREIRAKRERQEQSKQVYSQWLRKKTKELRHQRSQAASRRFNSSAFFNGSLYQSDFSSSVIDLSASIRNSPTFFSPVPNCSPSRNNEGSYEYLEAIPVKSNGRSRQGMRFHSQESLRGSDSNLSLS